LCGHLSSDIVSSLHAATSRAVEAGAPIAVFEFTERTPANLGGCCSPPLGVWRDTWDGIASHWRSYGAAELHALTEGLTGYTWESETLPPGARRDRITHLVGILAEY
jgi:hypothetical protein